jgi:hypothetical protein
LENEASFTRSRDKNIGHSHTGLEAIIYVSEHDTSTEEYTLVSDLPADCKSKSSDSGPMSRDILLTSFTQNIVLTPSSLTSTKTKTSRRLVKTSTQSTGTYL